MAPTPPVPAKANGKLSHPPHEAVMRCPHAPTWLVSEPFPGERQDSHHCLPVPVPSPLPEESSEASGEENTHSHPEVMSGPSTPFWCQQRQSEESGLRPGGRKEVVTRGSLECWECGNVLYGTACTSMRGLGYCAKVGRDVTIRGNWVKVAWELSVLFLTTAWESAII